MKRIVVLCVIFALLFSGCGFWKNKEYVSVEPYLDNDRLQNNTIPEPTNYIQLRDALLNLVENGVTEGTIIVAAFDQENVVEYMEKAEQFISQNSAIGAFTVENMTYEIGTSVGKAAVAVEISYNNNLSALRKMRRAENMEDALEILQNAMNKCEAGVVFLVDEYQDTDFLQVIQDYALQRPDKVMEVPQAAVSVYPDSGMQRVVEIAFTYQTSRETLRQMRDTVDPVFTSAKLYVSASANDLERVVQLYSFLMERYTYTVETSITPTYSLLCHGVGDCKAFAVTYAAMCNQAGVECYVVSGTRNAEPWFWNLVIIEGVYYHLDLLRCSLYDGFTLRTNADMEGYVWDYSAYQQTEESQ